MHCPCWVDFLWHDRRRVTPVCIDLSQARAQSSIRKGQQAWGRIKATAEEQRILWLEVGVALMYGKLDTNRPKIGSDSRGRPKYQKFSLWVQELFPGLCSTTTTNTMWFAKNSTIMVEIPVGLTHPTAIRDWMDNPKRVVDLDAPEVWDKLPSDLQEITPTPAIQLPQRDAEKVAKVILRAQSGGEGSDIAARHLEGLAKKHGTTAPVLTEAAKVEILTLGRTTNSPNRAAHSHVWLFDGLRFHFSEYGLHTLWVLLFQNSE